MRINLYAEELTTETQWLSKTTVQRDEATGRETRRTFYGVRFFLASPDALHDTPDDDDRSAVTLWVPWTAAEGHNWALVESLIENLGDRLKNALRHEQMREADEARARAGE